MRGWKGAATAYKQEVEELQELLADGNAGRGQMEARLAAQAQELECAKTRVSIYVYMCVYVYSDWLLRHRNWSVRRRG